MSFEGFWTFLGVGSKVRGSEVWGAGTGFGGGLRGKRMGTELEEAAFEGKLRVGIGRLGVGFSGIGDVW